MHGKALVLTITGNKNNRRQKQKKPKNKHYKLKCIINSKVWRNKTKKKEILITKDSVHKPYTTIYILKTSDYTQSYILNGGDLQ